jgi:hypothetical protein
VLSCDGLTTGGKFSLSKSLHEDLQEGNGVPNVQQTGVQSHVVAVFGPDFPVLSFCLDSILGDAFGLLSRQSKEVKLESMGCERESICQDLVCA